MDGCVDGCMDEWMGDGWMDARKNGETLSIGS